MTLALYCWLTYLQATQALVDRSPPFARVTPLARRQGFSGNWTSTISHDHQPQAPSRRYTANLISPLPAPPKKTVP